MAKGKLALGALLGAAAGFAAGILTAPKSGKETREDLKDTANKLKTEATDELEKAKGVATEKGNEVKKKAEAVAEDVTGRAQDVRARTEQAIDGAKKGFAKEPRKK